MVRGPSDIGDQGSAGFPETTLVIHSGFGKTMPAELSNPGRTGATLFGLLGPIDPDRSPFDFSKVNWLEVLFAIGAVLAFVALALLATWIMSA